MAGLVQPHPADNETIATVMQRHGDTAHTHTHTLIRTTGSRRACAVSLLYLFICLLAGTGVESASQAIRACLAVAEALQLHSHLQTRVENSKSAETVSTPSQRREDFQPEFDQETNKLVCCFAANGSKARALFAYARAPHT